MATVAGDMCHALGCVWVARRTGLPLPIGALFKPLALAALAYAVWCLALRCGLAAIPSALLATMVFAAQVHSLARRLLAQRKTV